MKNRYPGNMSFFCTCECCISYFFEDFKNFTLLEFLPEPRSHCKIKLPRLNINLKIPLSWDFCLNRGLIMESNFHI